MAVVDPVFQSLLDDNTDTGGLEGLWRVQKLELVPVPKRLVRLWKSILLKIIKFSFSQHGQFYEGDCYLLYDKKEETEHVRSSFTKQPFNELHRSTFG